MQSTAISKTLTAKPAEVNVWKSRLVADGPEVTQIRAKISSTTVDRDGDEFSIEGLQSMIPALKSGTVPYYLDHGMKESGARHYGALDMLGGWIDGEIVGNALYATAFIEPGNEAGERLAGKIAAGTPIGHSVGFGVLKSRPKSGGSLIFDSVSLWEVSAVGIPSNPDAVTAERLKSLRIKAGLEKKKAPTSDDERLILVRAADGSRRYCTVAAFRRGLRAGLDDTLAPLQEQISTLAAAAKAASSKSNGARGKSVHRIMLTGHGRRTA